MGSRLRYIWCRCECGRSWDMAPVPDIDTIVCYCGKQPRTVIQWDSPDEGGPAPQLEDGHVEGVPVYGPSPAMAVLQDPEVRAWLRSLAVYEDVYEEAP